MTRNNGELRIVALGDSITAAHTGDWPVAERWPARVEAGLGALFPNRKIRVINAGGGGNTAREGWARFEKDVAAHRPDVVLIEFGGNDATPEPDRHVALDEYKRILVVMIARCREMGAQPVLLTFPPIIDVWHCWQKEFQSQGGCDRYIEAYRDITRKVAVSEDVPLIDIDLALRSAAARHGLTSQVMPDGVHLTQGGNLTVALAVIGGLGHLIGNQH